MLDLNNSIEFSGVLDHHVGVDFDGANVPDYSMGVEFFRRLPDLSKGVEFSGSRMPDYSVGVEFFRRLLDIDIAVEFSGSRLVDVGIAVEFSRGRLSDFSGPVEFSRTIYHLYQLPYLSDFEEHMEVTDCASIFVDESAV